MCFALNTFFSNCHSSNFSAVRIQQEINNLAIPADCGVCSNRFTPARGLHPVLTTNKRPVCASCAAGAVDVTTPAQQAKNAVELARYEMLYRAPVYAKCA